MVLGRKIDERKAKPCGLLGEGGLRGSVAGPQALRGGEGGCDQVAQLRREGADIRSGLVPLRPLGVRQLIETDAPVQGVEKVEAFLVFASGGIGVGWHPVDRRPIVAGVEEDVQIAGAALLLAPEIEPVALAAALVVEKRDARRLELAALVELRRERHRVGGV